MKSIHFLFLAAVLSCCSENPLQGGNAGPNDAVVLCIQPFNDMPSAELQTLTHCLRTCFKEVKVLKPVPLPASAYYKPRGRYRAVKLLQFLNERTPDGNLTIGLTSKDISTSKGSFPDFGIMGLGLCPGKVCVASGARLKGKNRLEKFYKVTIHELGHTQGLPHCPVKTCLMRDAEGKDYLNEEIGFCKKCSTVLQRAGWNL